MVLKGRFRMREPRVTVWALENWRQAATRAELPPAGATWQPGQAPGPAGKGAVGSWWQVCGWECALHRPPLEGGLQEPKTGHDGT